MTTTTMKLDIPVLDILDVINPFERTIDKIILYTSSVKYRLLDEATTVTIDGDNITVNAYWELFSWDSHKKIIKLHKDAENHYSGHYSSGEQDYSYPIHIFKIDDKLIRVRIVHSHYVVTCENENIHYDIFDEIVQQSSGVTQSIRDVLNMIKPSRTQSKYMRCNNVSAAMISNNIRQSACHQSLLSIERAREVMISSVISGVKEGSVRNVTLQPGTSMGFSSSEGIGSTITQTYYG